jgi:cytidine deaminase
MYPIDLVRHANPELFIALVAPVGADSKSVCESLRETLGRFEYTLKPVRVVEELKQFGGYLENESTEEFEKIKGRMDAGDKFREGTKRKEALAWLSLSRVRSIRKESGSAEKPVGRQAYLFRSLKRPEEVTALRRIYASNLIVIAVHSEREKRIINLADRIAKSRYSAQSANFRAEAEKLILRDESDETIDYGQKLRQAFGMSDVFLDAGDPHRLREDLDRFFDLLFGKPVITPTPDEIGMAHAYLAAMRSAELGRQVGAAICDSDGKLISIGTNEVPKAHGGHYWDSDNPDGRDWARGFDSSDRYKSSSLGELLKTLGDHNMLAENLKDLPIPQQMVQIRPLLKQTRYMQLIEFQRAVHGEMSAITDAASRGVSIKGCTLFVTTFPCHECTRMIVATGIDRVVYIEPYAKSLALEFHGDSIELGSNGGAGKIPFVPFLGVAPRTHINMFGMPDRKQPDGSVIPWDPADAFPRVSGSFWSYLQYEKEDLKLLKDALEKIGLKLV